MSQTEVFVVHENIPYEFGRVRGVFASEDAAIAYAETLANAENLTVARWVVSDDSSVQEEVEVWERHSGKPGKKLTS
jgi:hypothetical protein